MTLRIILTNTRYSPTRDEIIVHDRAAGERFFAQFALEWAGYIVENDTFILSAQWLYEGDQRHEIVEHARLNELRGFHVRIYDVVEEEPEEIALI